MRAEHKKRQIIDKANRRARKLRPKCFFSSCSEVAINSHSQSFGRSLKNISVDGKVIGISIDFFRPPEYVDDWFKEISIRQASLFKGFCWKHDNEFFKSVDDFELAFMDKKTLAKLAFRTFAMEVRTKQQVTCILSTIIKESEGIFYIEDLRYYNLGQKIFLQKDYPYYLSRFETMFNSDNYADTESAVFLLSRNIGISCSSVVDPTLMGQEDLDIHNTNKPQPAMFFTVLPYPAETIVIFTYFMDDKGAASNFIGRYGSLEDMVFNNCEDVLFNPDFFHSLNDGEKWTIVKALAPWMVWEKVQFPDLFKVSLTSPNYY